MGTLKPHLLGIDDAPFDKGQEAPVPIVGVMMEGATLVEGVAVTTFPVDGAGATGFLANWVAGQRWHAALQAVVLGGITIAGLGVVDLQGLAVRLNLPVIAVTRRDTAESTLGEALKAAGLSDRLPVLERTPRAFRLTDGLYLSWAGTDRSGATRLIRASLHKAALPEPLRIAHLIGTALVRGASRGRV